MNRRLEAALCSTTILSACLTLILIAAACGQPPSKDTRAADESAVRDLDAQWSKTAGTRNLDATVAYYTDDASLLPPNAPLAADKQSIRAVWTQLLAPDSSLSWQSTKVEAARSGDFAYTTGSYQFTAKDPHGNPIADRGKFLEVWKKQADGKWKVVADVYNSDVPLPAPAPAPKKKSTHHKQSHKKAHSKSHPTND